jgi:hypothetical protein
VLLFLRECRQDMIKQGCGGADEFSGALFHGVIVWIVSHGVGHLRGHFFIFDDYFDEPSSRFFLDR